MDDPKDRIDYGLVADDLEFLRNHGREALEKRVADRLRQRLKPSDAGQNETTDSDKVSETDVTKTSASGTPPQKGGNSALRNRILSVFFILAGSFIAQVGIKVWREYKKDNFTNRAVATTLTPVQTWKRYELNNTEISIELPAPPVEQPVPAQVKETVDDAHQYALQQGDGFGVMVMELKTREGLVPNLKKIAEASMMSVRRQDPLATHEIKIVSDKKATLTGSTSPKMKSLSIRGCYLIKRTDNSGMSWTVFIISEPSKSAEADRIFSSVQVKGLDEDCH